MVAWGRGRVNTGRPGCSVGSERIAPRGSTALMASVAWAIVDPARRPVILLLLALHVYVIGSHLVVHFALGLPTPNYGAQPGAHFTNCAHV